ncbi:MAG: hypothetical protein ACRD88_13290 [Terriglobia bacterium]
MREVTGRPKAGKLKGKGKKVKVTSHSKGKRAQPEAAREKAKVKSQKVQVRMPWALQVKRAKLQGKSVGGLAEGSVWLMA